MQDLIEALQQTLGHEIPLTQHLQLRVSSYDEHGLVLKAPLAPNINHKRTAFAGSLNSVVTLTGWGLLWLALKELGIPANIVIQDSTCHFLRPVSNDFAASCSRLSQEQRNRMIEALEKRGKARLELQVEIRNETKVAVLFTGRYVILARNEKSDG